MSNIRGELNARLLLDVVRGATVIPAAVVQHTARGPFVFVVNGDHTVAARPVTPGVANGDRVAIDRGLRPVEQVVIDGVDRLCDRDRRREPVAGRSS